MEREAIAELQRETAGKSAADIIRLTLEKFGSDTVFASSLGAEDQIIADLIFRQHLEVPVFTLDTGRWFEETYQLLQQTEQRYGIRFRIYFPDREEVENMVAEHGVNLFRDSVEKRKLCCQVRKIHPLQRALSGFKVWICGLRRE